MEVGLIVSLNRMEAGKGGKVAALQEVSERWGMPTAAIVSMDVTEALYNNEVDGKVIDDNQMKGARKRTKTTALVVTVGDDP